MVSLAAYLKVDFPRLDDPTESKLEREKNLGKFWATFAMRLARFTVPALMNPVKVGRKKSSLRTFSIPGVVGLLSEGQRYRIDAAGFVQIVNSRRAALASQNKTASLKAALRQIADWHAGRVDAIVTNETFGRYKTLASLTTAWNKIPREIKRNPDSFLPKLPKEAVGFFGIPQSEIDRKLNQISLTKSK